MKPGDTQRRPTLLAAQISQRIRSEGPLTVAEYMRVCLHDPAHGYYRTQQAIGRAGDFITAPEISQVFGELIGLWCAVVWQQMGAPSTLNLIELGPGRGTLMRDA
ncbi:MAG: SAM-dependent methyltransferase, partial [Hyphomicrobiaceae bacterium]|nr:SAM-dependent methyltransferase [Hyphomicrobiaceae bacterium]